MAVIDLLYNAVNSELPRIKVNYWWITFRKIYLYIKFILQQEESIFNTTARQRTLRPLMGVISIVVTRPRKRGGRQGIKFSSSHQNLESLGLKP